jgi:hypothetical protein
MGGLAGVLARVGRAGTPNADRNGPAKQNVSLVLGDRAQRDVLRGRVEPGDANAQPATGDRPAVQDRNISPKPPPCGDRPFDIYAGRQTPAAIIRNRADLMTVLELNSRGSISTWIDVFDRVLGKGIVIDAWALDVPPGGPIDLVATKSRIAILSIDTYWRLAHSYPYYPPRSPKRDRH